MSNNKQIEKHLELPHQETVVGINTIQTKPFDNQKITKMSNNKQRPPLGLMPHSVFLLRRLEEIFEAIERYHQANMQIPIEWITEYNLLIEMYKNNLGNNEQR